MQQTHASTHLHNTARRQDRAPPKGPKQPQGRCGAVGRWRTLALARAAAGAPSLHVWISAKGRCESERAVRPERGGTGPSLFVASRIRRRRGAMAAENGGEGPCFRTNGGTGHDGGGAASAGALPVVVVVTGRVGRRRPVRHATRNEKEPRACRKTATRRCVSARRGWRLVAPFKRQ